MTSDTSTLRFAPADAATRPDLGRLLATFCHAVVGWYARGLEQRRLAALPDYRLRDLGISREQALAEGARAFRSS